jgi:hypothetical protein
LDHRAFDLILEVVGMEDGAAFEGGDGTDDADFACGRIYRDFDAGGDEGAFFGAAGETNAAALFALAGASD